MDLFSEVTYDSLFINTFQQQAYLESLSNQALSRGIDQYTKKDYDKAAQEFQRSLSLSPNSTYSVDATKYLAQTYLKLGKTEKAIEAYKTALQRHTAQDDLHSALGNIYFSEDRFQEAVKSYEAAVNINPSSSNRYSLGQGYMHTEQYGLARSQFNMVIRLEPQSAYGYYGLGQTLAKEGSYERAIEQFDKAIRYDREFSDAYLEKGYAYADMGELDKAGEMAELLEDQDSDLSDMLKAYMGQVESPKILFAWGSSTFRYTKSVNTPVASLDAYLENAGAAKSMTIKLQFNKAMDRASVENPLNWNISRSTIAKPGQTYNFGEAVPDTEVTLAPFPDYVLYDADSMMATVGFTLYQNETADGTIDPGHILFKFMGKDDFGLTMDSDYDEFSGFSGSV